MISRSMDLKYLFGISKIQLNKSENQGGEVNYTFTTPGTIPFSP